MNTNNIILEHKEHRMSIPDHFITDFDVQKALTKYGQEARKAFQVQDRLLPVPGFLPERITKTVPGEDTVKWFADFQGISTASSRGYVNMVRLIFSLEWIEYLEIEQAIFHSNI